MTAFDLSGNETFLGEVCGSDGPAPEPGGTEGTTSDGATGSDDTSGHEPAPGDTAGSTGEPTNEPGDTTSDDPSADGLGDRGCSCDASPRGAAASWLAGLLLVVARRRRGR